MKNVLSVLVCALAMSVAVPAAQTKPAERPEALKRLEFMVGQFRVTGMYGTEKVDQVMGCEWFGRVLFCRMEPSKPTEWPELQLYSYNDRTKHYEGAFTDGEGKVGRHPVRWEGPRLIAEYEYFVEGAHHMVRRYITPQPDGGFLWTIEDLNDEKVHVVFELKATRRAP